MKYSLTPLLIPRSPLLSPTGIFALPAPDPSQPFGFQSERRSLFEARDVYIQVSPTFFADQVNEPVLLIHGNDDSNPGTLTYQSEVFFEAVRGSGGIARIVHVLWEQLEWFDRHVKGKQIVP